MQEPCVSCLASGKVLTSLLPTGSAALCPVTVDEETKIALSLRFGRRRVRTPRALGPPGDFCTPSTGADARSFARDRRFSLGAHHCLPGKRTVTMVPFNTLAPRVRDVPLPSTITPQTTCVESYGMVAVSSRLALAGLI